MNYYKMKSNQKSPSNGINIKLSNIDKKLSNPQKWQFAMVTPIEK